MKLIYGGPTTGKSSAIVLLRDEGVACLDTDWLIEAAVIGELNLAQSDWEAAWDDWKKRDPEGRKPITDSIINIITHLSEKKLSDLTPLLIFTNLHWEGMKPDFAYFRDPACLLELFKTRAEAKGRLLSPEEEKEVSSWQPPANIPNLVMLGKGAFIDYTDLHK